MAFSDKHISEAVRRFLPTARFLRTGSAQQDLGAVVRHLEDAASLLQHTQRAAIVTRMSEHSGCADEAATVTLAPLALDFLHATAAVGCVQHAEVGAPL